MSDLLAKIDGDFEGKDVVSLDQFDKKSLQTLFTVTKKIKKTVSGRKIIKILNGKVVTLLFYEPSSRTFGSFASAVKLLGGETVEIQDPQHFSSVSKGETFADTIRTFEAYSDAIVIRHPVVGSAGKAAEAATFVPVINAGDGIGEHPTQALLDLFTIYEKFNRLDNLVGVLAGDLLNGRTIHSLIRGLSLYRNNVLYLLSPLELQLSRKDFTDLKERGVKLVEIDNEKDIPRRAHFWYWTRVQKERFEKIEDYERVKNHFIVTRHLLNTYAGKNTILMHPLPRVGEILLEVDSDPRAVYLTTQIRNGLYIRMALLSLIFGKKI